MTVSDLDIHYLIARQAVLQSLDDAMSVSASGNRDLSCSVGHTSGASLRGTTSSLAYALPSHNHFVPRQPASIAGPSILRANTEDMRIAAAVEADRRRLGDVQNALRQHLIATQAAERHQQDLYISLLHTNQARSSLLALSCAGVPKAATPSLLSASQDFYGSQRGASSKNNYDIPIPVGLPNKIVSAEDTSYGDDDTAETIKILCALGTKRCGNSNEYPYVDVSHLPVTGEATKNVRGGITEPFTQKLYNMLEEVEALGKSRIVSFFPHGRSFAIRDMPAFVSEILPKYFEKQSKRVSFVRQLNLYGFIRIHSGQEAGGYYHELFLKGRPDLHGYMRRVGASVVNSEDRRKTKDRHVMVVQPNFYTFDAIHARRRVD